MEKTPNSICENVITELAEEIETLKKELEIKDNLLTIKNSLFDNLDLSELSPISVANVLITHTTKCGLQTSVGEVNTFSDDELEQIAEHLLLHCKHNKSRIR